MKTREQVQAEIQFGDVYTFSEYCNLVAQGYLTPYDGIGYFHDGEKESNISVWNFKYDEVWGKYPYVCWYNK